MAIRDLFLTLILCIVLQTAVSTAHIYVVGSRGPAPLASGYGSSNYDFPCPGPLVATNRLNAPAGATFGVTWTFIVNHNNPPNPVGTIQFGFGFDEDVTNTTKFAYLPDLTLPVVSQPVNSYTATFVPLPATMGPVTLQVYYNANLPGQAFTQCIDLNLQ